MQSTCVSDYWSEQTIDDLFVAAMGRFPDKTALVAHRADRPDAEPLRLSYRELGDRVARAAAGLRDLGVRRGDVVSIQLPNWWEFAVAALACGRLGAVVNPLIPNFRERELSYMLAFCETRVFIVPKLFRGFDHAAMAEGLRAQLPHLNHVVVVDGEGEASFERLLMQYPEAAVAPDPAFALSPDELAVLMFTSGSTGAPKCVMHNNYSLVASIKAFAAGLNLGADDTLLACSPLGHMTSYLAVLMQSLAMGATVVLQDVWQAKRGVALMAAEGVTHTAASTAFLTDLCDAVASGSQRPQRLRTFLCAGAPIPPVLIERAAHELDLSVSSQWGMSEALAATLTEPARAREKSSSTDGRPFEGMQARVVDTHGALLPAYETGRLLVRGPRMFMGYFKQPTTGLFDEEGWFDTGDLAFMDEEGYIRINGRTKDMLIRGGENIPVLEIESLLYQHPAVAMAAIVGFPDARLGERACAFVVLRAGTSLDLADVQAWMLEHQVAKQYWPERVAVLPEMPVTASGKIQKFALRERAKAFVNESTGDRA
jgi:cyclohexanecarboxylate-CoA ligase